MRMNSAEILDRLIGFPTVSRDSNLGLIDFVRGFLSSRGDELGRCDAMLDALLGRLA